MYDVLNAYLENGLKVILHKIPGVKTMACGLWIRQGSVYETDENNGLSHLVEHLLLNPKEIKRIKCQMYANYSRWKSRKAQSAARFGKWRRYF